MLLNTLLPMKRMKLDLHPIAKDGEKIERALQEALKDAKEQKARSLELIPGKGSGQLKKKVLKFFERKEVRSQYHRLEKDKDNSGRIFIHFKHR